MENASKALIIAGAILLSILIIGIGMAVFNMARSTANRANLDEQVVMTYNQKFTQYQGEAVRGSAVEALISQIVAVNADDDDFTPQILFTFDATVFPRGEINLGAARPRQSSTYTVVMSYDDGAGSLTRGMIDEITVTRNP